jgi:hypothetical protein
VSNIEYVENILKLKQIKNKYLNKNIISKSILKIVHIYKLNSDKINLKYFYSRTKFQILYDYNFKIVPKKMKLNE